MRIIGGQKSREIVKDLSDLIRPFAEVVTERQLRGMTSEQRIFKNTVLGEHAVMLFSQEEPGNNGE